MRDKFTDITIVLDRSGSMQSVKADTIGGFNQFVEDQKKVPGDACLTLVQFDTEYEFVHRGVGIKDVPAMTTATYVPRGATALLDAMGRAINETGARLSGMAEHDRPSQVICVVMTDGQENSSREFTRQQVFDLIKQQSEAYKWQFVFLGANQDAIQEAAKYGIHAGAAMNYAASADGTKHALRAMSAGVARHRTAGTPQMDCYFSDEEREQAKEASSTKS